MENRTEPAGAPIGTETGEEESGPNWPGDADEVSFLAESRNRGESDLTAPPPKSDREVEDRETLPPLEAQVARVPAELRATLDDLFRAKFTRVTRVKALGGAPIS